MNSIFNFVRKKAELIVEGFRKIKPLAILPYFTHNIKLFSHFSEIQ